MHQTRIREVMLALWKVRDRKIDSTFCQNLAEFRITSIMRSQTQISCISINYRGSEVRVSVNRAVNTISNPNYTCCHRQIQGLTVRNSCHSFNCRTKDCCVWAVCNMKAINILIDIDVTIFTILNFDIDTLVKIAFVFYRDAFVQECDVIWFRSKCILSKCFVTTAQTILLF